MRDPNIVLCVLTCVVEVIVYLPFKKFPTVRDTA